MSQSFVRPRKPAPASIRRVPLAGGRSRFAQGGRIATSAFRSTNAPLPESARSPFDERFDSDFSSVRVHGGANAAGSARSVRAFPYPAGPDVVFGAGRHSPAGLRISEPGDRHEREAEQFAASLPGSPGPRSGDPATAPEETAADAGGSGRALPIVVQEYFGARLGHRFEHVRVHTNDIADAMARRLAASAFTVGSDIYFRSGWYAPHTDNGRSLLGHELAHVRQQALAGPRLDRKVFTEEELEAMHPPSATPQIGLLGSSPAHELFAARMAAKYHTRSVVTGTFQDQAQDVASRRVDLPPGVMKGTLDRATWKEWSPPSGWETYKAILDAIDAFARNFGGLPEIKEVVLFDVAYEVNQTTGLVQPQPNIGASFGAGQLTIYSAITKSGPLPAGRSGVPFAGQQAKLVDVPSQREAVERSITHELGHGVAEMAVGAGKTGPEPDMLETYRREVGWTALRRGRAGSTRCPASGE
jgi:uncharacterized protein DUF4157